MEFRSANRALCADLTGGAANIPGLLWDDPHSRTLALALATDRLDIARTDPRGLQEELRREFPDPEDLALLVASGVDVTEGRCADVHDWTARLHQPMARCFTLLSAAMPLVRRAHDGGHAILVIPSHALVHDPERGPGSVLGRGLLGLFEGLAAELRRTATRVTIFLTDKGEPDAILRARFATARQRRPLYAPPAALSPAVVRDYFRPIAAALRATPAGAPLPAGPMGAIYRAALEAIGHGLPGGNPPPC